jgi:hypothetical protein
LSGGIFPAMTSIEHARELALALPEAVEQDQPHG